MFPDVPLIELELHTRLNKISEHPFARTVASPSPRWRNRMTKLKLLTAAAVLSTLVAAPAMAQDVVVHRDHAYHRGPVGAAVDGAAGIAGAAIGTAGAIATAPFRDSYNYDRGYDYDSYMGPNGYACHPGTWFKGEDGRRHICQ
jgi:hypothetical protein